jgi:hypothetical protein
MAKRTRPIEGVVRRYQWRLYPTPAQDEALRGQAAMCAQLWNAMLEMCEQRYQRACAGPHVFHCAACAALSGTAGKLKLCHDHALPSEFTMSAWISRMREECPEWKELSTWTPRRVATSLAAAWSAFFRRLKLGEDAGYPRYKSTRHALAVPHRCLSGCSLQPYNARTHGAELNGFSHVAGRNKNSWVVYFKGVPSLVWARSALPGRVNEWTDADVRYLDGRWSISAALTTPPRRVAGHRPIVVRFDLVDGFAIVDNEPDTPQELLDAATLCEAADDKRRQTDLAYPRGKKLSEPEHEMMMQERAIVAADLARAARKRKNALHVWTARLVRRASAITIYAPPVKKVTRSARGDHNNWGAAVADVAAINRAALNYAPATAVAMLLYKAAEAGIACEVIEDQAPALAIGGALKQAAKHVRTLTKRAKRELTKAPS